MIYIGFFVFWVISVWVMTSDKKAKIESLKFKLELLENANHRLQLENFELLRNKTSKLRIVK